MFLALIAGALADVFDKRLLMMIAQLFMLTVSVGLSVIAYMGLVTPWVLLICTF